MESDPMALVAKMIEHPEKLPEKMCCICGHALLTHFEELPTLSKIGWRCHCLGLDGYQCECFLRKDSVASKVDYYDFKRRVIERTEGKQ